MLELKFTAQFKKDYKLAIKRGFKADDLQKVVNYLLQGKKLPLKYKDHELEITEKYYHVRECHIKPDWLLVYRIENGECVLRLIRTGTHSDLF